MSKLLNLVLTTLIAVMCGAFLRRFDPAQANLQDAAALVATTALVGEALDEIPNIPQVLKSILLQGALLTPISKFMDNLVENFIVKELGIIEGNPVAAPVSEVPATPEAPQVSEAHVELQEVAPE